MNGIKLKLLLLCFFGLKSAFVINLSLFVKKEEPDDDESAYMHVKKDRKDHVIDDRKRHLYVQQAG